VSLGSGKDLGDCALVAERGEVGEVGSDEGLLWFGGDMFRDNALPLGKKWSLVLLFPWDLTILKITYHKQASEDKLLEVEMCSLKSHLNSECVGSTASEWSHWGVLECNFRLCEHYLCRVPPTDYTLASKSSIFGSWISSFDKDNT